MAGFLQGVGNFLTGTPGQTQQFQRFTPQQQGLQNTAINSIQDILKMLQPGGGQGGQEGPGSMGQFDFAPIAQQARTQFQTQTAPSIAERFASLGGSGTKGSSGLNAALAGAGANLEQGLAGLQSKYNLAQGGQQNQLLQLLLSLAGQPSFENAYFPSRPGFLQSAASGIGQGLGSFGGLAGLQYLGLI